MIIFVGILLVSEPCRTCVGVLQHPSDHPRDLDLLVSMPESRMVQGMERERERSRGILQRQENVARQEQQRRHQATSLEAVILRVLLACAAMLLPSLVSGLFPAASTLLSSPRPQDRSDLLFL